MGLEPNESLKDAFASEHCITANFVDHRKLKQAGGKQQKKKTQAVLGNDVRPSDEFAARCAKAMNMASGPRDLSILGRRKRRRFIGRQNSPRRRIGHLSVDAVYCVWRKGSDKSPESLVEVIRIF